jgi:hypothetical protein
MAILRQNHFTQLRGRDSNNPGALTEKAVFACKMALKSGQEETRNDHLCYNFREALWGMGLSTKKLHFWLDWFLDLEYDGL